MNNIIEIADTELDDMQKFQEESAKPHRELLEASGQELTVNRNGYVTSGTWFIPPFVGPYLCPPKPRTKPITAKCVCLECGNKHNKKGGRA